MVLLLIFLLMIITVVKFKTKIKGRAGNDGEKNVKIRVSLKYLSIFWRALEISLINCEINLILTWSNKCFILDNPIVGQEPTFTILIQNLMFSCNFINSRQCKTTSIIKIRFKRTINWNKCEPKVTVKQRN